MVELAKAAPKSIENGPQQGINPCVNGERTLFPLQVRPDKALAKFVQIERSRQPILSPR